MFEEGTKIGLNKKDCGVRFFSGGNSKRKCEMGGPGRCLLVTGPPVSYCAAVDRNMELNENAMKLCLRLCAGCGQNHSDR